MNASAHTGHKPAETDLFGDAVTAPHAKRGGFGSTRQCGYAALPGTGQTGKHCKDCAHYRRVNGGGLRSFPKCGLMRAYWTHGAGTDIKAGSPACREFTAKAQALALLQGGEA